MEREVQIIAPRPKPKFLFNGSKSFLHKNESLLIVVYPVIGTSSSIASTTKLMNGRKD